MRCRGYAIAWGFGTHFERVYIIISVGKKLKAKESLFLEAELLVIWQAITSAKLERVPESKIVPKLK